MASEKDIISAMKNEFDGYPADCIVGELLDLRKQLATLDVSCKDLYNNYQDVSAKLHESLAELETMKAVANLEKLRAETAQEQAEGLREVLVLGNILCHDIREQYSKNTDLIAKCDWHDAKVAKALASQPASPWISVKDRLPEVGEEVWTSHNGHMGVCFLPEDGKWYKSNGNETRPPSHWLPMLAIPESERE